MYFPASRRPSPTAASAQSSQTFMAGTSRIDELRKKFDENPRRYFAPLANEYRKIGDFEQAIFICQEFLPQQPGHMSGHIVYGQALFESGRHDEARAVFETALALDPENLIALRHLGDIARARGDAETAGAWYRRVLESDPRNEEIAGILSSLDGEVAAGAVAPTSAPADAASKPAAAAGAPPPIESAISAATGSGEQAAATSADPIVTDPLTTAPAESNFDDIAKLFTSATPSPASAPTDDSLGLIHEGEDVLGTPQGASSPAASSSADIDRGEADKAAHRESATAPAESAPAFNLPFLEGLTSPAPEPAPAVVESPPPTAAAQDAAAAFVTETMAELYVKQGHREQALDVYRQLVQRQPNDAALAARLRELEGGAQQTPARRSEPEEPTLDAAADAGPTIREFLWTIAGFRRRGEEAHNETSPPGQSVSPATHRPNEEPPAARRSGSVGDSLSTLFAGAEQSSVTGVDEFADAFRKPTESSRAEPTALPGRPSTPAASELSLDHVFRHATPAAGNQSHGSFSFDQFFSQQAQQDVSARDAEPSPDESAGLSDDIQQFNAWLEGLKKT
jgi:tetratricopeptide (TPR) repeat protein